MSALAAVLLGRFIGITICFSVYFIVVLIKDKKSSKHSSSKKITGYNNYRKN